MFGEKDAAEFRQVLSCDDTGTPSLAAFGYARGRNAPLPVLEHRHRDKAELILCDAGMQMYSVNSRTGTLYAGECLFIRPNEEHACLHEQPGASRIFWMQLDLDTADGILGVCGEEGSLLRQTLYRFPNRRMEASEEIRRSVGRAYQLFCSGDAMDRVLARALLLGALLELLRAPALGQILTPEIDRAKQYILLHVREQIGLDELLAVSGLSMSEFRKRFEAQTGMKPRAFITRIKIEHSRQELRDPQRSDTDIAYLYHFPTVSLYRTQFKKVTGMSVRQYRRGLKRTSGSRPESDRESGPHRSEGEIS